MRFLLFAAILLIATKTCGFSGTASLQPPVVNASAPPQATQSSQPPQTPASPQPQASVASTCQSSGTTGVGSNCQSPSPEGVASSPSPSASSAPGASTMMDITFYNLPGSMTPATTADGSLTNEGSGAYNDPITMATAPTELPDKAVVYVKGFNKYFIHTDDCVKCTSDWASGMYHLDLWLGADPGSCAITWGVLQLPVVINPSPTLPVSSQPMESGTTCFPLPSPLPTS